MTFCDERDSTGRFICTLDEKHLGDHEADGTRPLLTWPKTKISEIELVIMQELNDALERIKEAVERETNGLEPARYYQLTVQLLRYAKESQEHARAVLEGREP